MLIISRSFLALIISRMIMLTAKLSRVRIVNIKHTNMSVFGFNGA